MVASMKEVYYSYICKFSQSFSFLGYFSPCRSVAASAVDCKITVVVGIIVVSIELLVSYWIHFTTWPPGLWQGIIIWCGLMVSTGFVERRIPSAVVVRLWIHKVSVTRYALTFSIFEIPPTPGCKLTHTGLYFLLF